MDVGDRVGKLALMGGCMESRQAEDQSTFPIRGYVRIQQKAGQISAVLDHHWHSNGAQVMGVVPPPLIAGFNIYPRS